MLKVSKFGSTDDVIANDSALQLTEIPLANADELESFISELNDRHKYRNTVTESNPETDLFIQL
jgi:hypothetical protein